MLRAATPPRTRPEGYCPFSSPMKATKRRDFDDCSTAAPSPAMTDLASPWGTPFQGQSSPCPFGSSSPWDRRETPMKPRNILGGGTGGNAVAELSSPWSTPIHELYAAHPGFGWPSGGLLNDQPPAPPAPDSPWSMAAMSFMPIGLEQPPEEMLLPAALGEEEAAAPVTPRAAAPVPTTPRSTPPSTPRDVRRPRTSSPPGAPKEMPPPNLMRALCANDAEKVRAILEEDPQAANTPFWDHDVSPPLCMAMRIGCSLPVVQALLEYGADPEKMVDSKGQSALTILASRQSVKPTMSLDPWSMPPVELPSGPIPVLPGRQGEVADGVAPLATFSVEQVQALLGWSPQERQSVERDLAVAEALVNVGADPMAPDAQGCCALDVAMASNNEHLVRLWLRPHLELKPVREESFSDLTGGQAAETGSRASRTTLADVLFPVH